MTKQRYLRWPSEPPRPKHGYRDTAFVYLFLCAVVVLFAWLSGGSVVKGVVVAAILFVVGSVYSLVRWHDLARHLRGRGNGGS
jgi:membrane protein YdbS with pleckstrin-like domain